MLKCDIVGMLCIKCGSFLDSNHILFFIYICVNYRKGLIIAACWSHHDNSNHQSNNSQLINLIWKQFSDPLVAVLGKETQKQLFGFELGWVFLTFNIYFRLSLWWVSSYCRAQVDVLLSLLLLIPGSLPPTTINTGRLVRGEINHTGISLSRWKMVKPCCNICETDEPTVAWVTLKGALEPG